MADVSVWATVAVAGVTGAAAIAGTLITGRLQLKTEAQRSDAAIQQAAQERFKEWQIYKREVYADFLRAARQLSGDLSDSVLRAAYLDQRDRTLLVANRELRAVVKELPDLQQSKWTQEAWSRLSDACGFDARQEGPAS
jgi:hypothetical protein